MAASSLENAQRETVVLFGGTGFIGSHLAMHWLQQTLAARVILVDLNPPRAEPWTAYLQQELAAGRAEFVRWDVRQPIPASLLPKADLIFNLAAVHREPGHQAHEYFETNIKGAENVCAWAAATGCDRIVFTSSIAPYGASEEMKDEASLPAPDSPYGSSKLAAEKIHLAWQAGCDCRKLLMLRPGVVFGPGEEGNVTRLVRSVVKGYFVYMGNRKTRKAGGYVKELCRAIRFGLEHQDEGRRSRHAAELLSRSASDAGRLCCRNPEGRGNPPIASESAAAAAAGDFVSDSCGGKHSRNPAADQPGSGSQALSLDLDRSQRTARTRLQVSLHAGNSAPGLEA